MDNININFLIYIIAYLGFAILFAVRAYRTKHRETISATFVFWTLLFQVIGFYVFFFHLTPPYQMGEEDINELSKLLFVYMPILSMAVIYLIEKILFRIRIQTHE